MNPGQAFASAALVGGNALLNGGAMQYYSGSIPASPETAITTQTLLATDAFANPAFGTPSFTSPNEGAVANWVNTTFSPTTQGVVGFARGVKADGTTAVNDYTVGLAGSGADIILGGLTLQPGVPMTNGTFKHNIPAF